MGVMGRVDFEDSDYAIELLQLSVQTDEAMEWTDQRKRRRTVAWESLK
jgi:hypothetical protein